MLGTFGCQRWLYNTLCFMKDKYYWRLDVINDYIGCHGTLKYLFITFITDQI